MSEKQWRLLDAIERVERGELTVSGAAVILGYSRRQLQRLRKQVAAEGAVGVVHKNTGRAPRHRIPDVVRAQIVALWREKYVGFNDQHFTEKLRECEDIVLSRETVRRILRAGGVAAARPRRGPKHRRRRDRRPQAGHLMLWDGSQHDWLEGRGPRLCLMGAIDDATGEFLPGAHFVDQECTVGYLRLLRDVVAQKGVPLAVYMDRHGSLSRNDKNWSLEEQLAGRRTPTQVGQALYELGIHTIYALSPQAKGRIERLWGTLQDRLVSELRLANACTPQEAAKVLNRYRREHNRKFAVAPKDTNPVWRTCPTDRTPSEFCALTYIRIVQSNNTVRIGGKIIDIPKRTGPGRRASYARAEVVVRHLLSGQYRVYFQGLRIARANGPVPTSSTGEYRTSAGARKQKSRQAKWRAASRGVTESLTS